ncbi:hypothetical protein CANTEDRAFT_116819 [Yamadazyma tenuis ATCC 10573]|uniref:Protein-tyrosine phosphatase n=1 Tax=Candida tenuis (strain ATCC 10573 / BCRC 21748 / CBS 615 / JCM 9827 / NBRC 10315 / NRRL Y-1498 / VKM Y-70) TaxID=590646 RepID=G3BC04_CANTC|nr:uncharacterized protein CANTEDRAFT_116819 [Yamadazyma tenuis ATCC 10573]EGV61255.1 hypothetical protein CANTEDRAFT_116819 [Yamadazyma tenuis ATCC 10573]
MARVSEANTIPTSPDRDAYHDNGLKLPADGQLDNGVPVFTANARPPLVPPLNFSLVEDRIYRSGFPNPLNYPFLKQLGLKTIIYLGDLGQEYNAWIGTTNIQFHHLVMESSQEPFTSLQEQQQARDSLRTALQLMLDKNNFPMLIHSNKGKHRIGVLVGLMRKIFQGWCMSGIFEEYEKFALGKSEFDLEFMELWQPELWVSQDSRPEFLRS